MGRKIVNDTQPLAIQFMSGYVYSASTGIHYICNLYMIYI